MNPSTATCSSCSAPLGPADLSCPACHQLVHSAELKDLSASSSAAQGRGDLAAARDIYQKMLPLLPPESNQHAAIAGRLSTVEATLAEKAAAQAAEQNHPWRKRLLLLGPVGLFLWKFKFVVVFALTKAKLLLLGLTKLSTFTSMLAAIGLYWTWWGWKFALGFVLSIYVHEMGHVAALRRFGIPASAPMFVPGLGAFVRMNAHPASVGQDARVGLAGPIWGLGACLAALSLWLLTGYGVWAGVGRAAAWINLFNLVPIGWLDGGRAFRALTRAQRGLLLAAMLALWAATSEPLFFVLALGATWRLFTKDFAPERDDAILLQFAGLLAVFGAVCALVAPQGPR